MENQRIRLSKTMLKNGLLELLAEKPIGKISVYELCQRAEINRTTFYKYYGNPYDLLAEIEDDFFSKLNEDLAGIIGKSPQGLLNVLNSLYEQRVLFCMLVDAVPTKDFASRLLSTPNIDMILQGMLSANHYTDEEGTYMKTFLYNGAFAILLEWLRSETPKPAEQIAVIFSKIVKKLY